MWTYSSISGTDIDINTGLIGPVIITLTDQTNSTTGLPQGKSVCLSDFFINIIWSGVDREFVLLFSSFDEDSSPYLEQSVQTLSLNPASVTAQSMSSSNSKYAINGYLWSYNLFN